MSQPGLVSVVIPTFNDERFVSQAIRSVLDQSHTNVEIIVVDDGSTDRSVEIAEAIDGPIAVIKQSNSGSAAARNRGMAAARGEFIAFLDADDYWLPGKLQRQVEHLQAHPECSFAACAWREWRWPSIADPAKVAGEPLPPSEAGAIDRQGSGWLYPILLLDCSLQTSTVVLRRSLAEKVGPFDESLRRGQDYDYWLRCAQVTPIHKLQGVFALYRIREDSITKRVHEHNYGAILLERAVRLWGTRAPAGAGPGVATVSIRSVHRRIAKIWLDFAVGHAANGNRRVALSAAWRAIRWWPFEIVAWRCLIGFSVLPATLWRRQGAQE